jgi:ribose 5-phosphate isomerase A
MARQDDIERRQEIRRAVGERPVEVENEEWRGHQRRLSRPAKLGKASPWRIRERRPLVVRMAHAKARRGIREPVREEMSESLKRRAAEAALAFVEDGMRLGLGSGSTAGHFVRMLGERVAAGLRVVGVATSSGTEAIAREVGVPLTTLDEIPELDLDIDGADEIGPSLALIKGGGGALLREKIVASASRRMIVIADAGKQVATLGAYPLPIEAVAFGLAATKYAIERAAAELGLQGPIVVRKKHDAPFITDSGNLVLDASFGRIPDPEALASRLAGIPGIVEHGLFLGFADLALIASAEGVAELKA